MDMPTTTAVPADLQPFIGEILDADAHEHTPVNHWREAFGSITDRLAEVVQASTHPSNEFQEADDTELTPDNLWNQKRAAAPGSFNFDRRGPALDMMGVKSQMLFAGTMGLQAVILLATKDVPQAIHGSITEGREKYALDLIRAYNEWCVRTNDAYGPRVRPVVTIVGETVDDLISELKHWSAKGIRAFWTPASVLPGGVSPAHTDLDPFYDIFEQGNLTLCSHVGADLGFLKTERWRDAPAFSGFKLGGEFSLDPWTLNNMSKATENFMTTLVLGGVFERHPKLRYLVAEVAANWVGPLAYSMDMWIENSGAFNKRNTGWAMELSPSEYVMRNIRVVPFEFEDVGGYIKRFGLEDVYVYGSDFPHIEGGKNPMGRFNESINAAGLGDAVKRKFFCENAKWVLPD
ncbi:amidohydrolase family protein [Novosphingobium pentaromativorans]|uniref:Amidohydrolase-related domain-containing protein n=1 Tax=Novosphingobium pentaromativorans US6-1 TaxID=1088721 RepID=G6EGR3_9SPHN|nr:amidohydrolase family protein [Novosphingobium pentaromativorans]AIT82086.1 hypothetical protein JI59_21350 [Novosphingobium pentaromativorans US6-1]EHJ59506.1 hypothetical protein NSU_3534 [Novosphingobium pentaromativorans US6-1]